MTRLIFVPDFTSGFFMKKKKTITKSSNHPQDQIPKEDIEMILKKQSIRNKVLKGMIDHLQRPKKTE